MDICLSVSWLENLFSTIDKVVKKIYAKLDFKNVYYLIVIKKEKNGNIGSFQCHLTYL